MAIENITRNDITKEHIEDALKHLAQYGELYEGARNKQGIFSLYNTAHARGVRYQKNGKEAYFAIPDTVRVAALYAAGEMPKEGKVGKEKIKEVPYEIVKGSRAFLIKRGFEVPRFEKGVPSEGSADHEEQSLQSNITEEAISLLEDVGQIILCGPPGTGKTHCAINMILPQLLRVDEDEVDGMKEDRWDIVQFHPSYNYEDFVRGVKITTVNGKIDYEIGNRAFGEMCQKAAQDEDKNNAYVLIIDEINRANVSQVLGELIYALEYREKEVDTPYAIDVDGKRISTLAVPENLYIIGTMNTADRTIGQIDYAVRRRFAFVPCPPDKNFIEKNYKNAFEIFSLVDEMFDKKTGYVSPDYDSEDVRIGHSYFMAEGKKLAHKILYQVVPILKEYVKDGVLKKEAETKISQIEKKFSSNIVDQTLTTEEGAKERWDDKVRNGDVCCWDKGNGIHINNMGRTVLAIAHDYVRHHPAISLEDLHNWFPDRYKEAQSRGIKREIGDNDPKRFFDEKGDELLIEGWPVYDTIEWGSKNGSGNYEYFMEDVRGVDGGYDARFGCVVNLFPKEGIRSWDSCYSLGLISANGDEVGADKKLAAMEKFRELGKGMIVFVYLVGKGFVGMGEILEGAKPIGEFEKGGVLLLDSPCGDSGETYREKYPIAAEKANDRDNCEWVIPVEWKHRMPIEEVNENATTTPAHVAYSNMKMGNLEILKKQFDKK